MLRISHIKSSLNSVRYISQCNKLLKIIDQNENDRRDSILHETKILIDKLTLKQQNEILVDLQLKEANLRKKDAEDKLASWHWRSEFGRPTSLHLSKVDPTGTYCEIPHDWIQKKMAESEKTVPPTTQQLRQLAVFNALPFVGFGFLDNLIMIIAGDYIDATIGIYLGISTMAAAALGNTVSDLAGIGSAWYVENIAVKIGIHAPELSRDQKELRSSTITANLGRAIGVVVGCILGMFPLFFLPAKSSGADKKTEKTVPSL